ncbi:MAG TPA: hypothetical protein VM049_01935 [Gaiellaceae bacterium]|nr:hypothetical protein [Gaiellaceae bacterium]
MKVVDELVDGFGWIAEKRPYRTSHALAADGRVWLFDVVDDPELDRRARALGEPAGVVQLLDRHARDCAGVARRLGIPHHIVPRQLQGTPFELRPVAMRRWWREVALWWPERRILLVADAVGTLPFFRAGEERVGLHPLLRPRPPHALRGLAPEHLLVGHGVGIHHHPAALETALSTARRRIPRWLLGLPGAFRSA